MNSRIFIREKIYIDMRVIFVLSFLLLAMTAQAGWNVDFSRRSKELRKDELKPGATPEKEESILDSVFSSSAPVQEMVVLNTEQGFIPSTVRVKTGAHYKLHIVNVNEKEKNVSFVLDAFSEHHSTYFGKIKSLVITPQKEGIFTFQCPETSAQGRLIVYPDASSRPQAEVEQRAPANAE